MTVRFSTAAAAAIEPLALAELAAPYQSAPETSCAYIGEEPAAIAQEIAAAPQWATRTFCAMEGDRLVGWLCAELDVEIGRVWWWGPFAPEPSVADELYRRALAALPESITQQEAAGPDANRSLAAFCQRHGLSPQPGSLLLECREPPEAAAGNVAPLSARGRVAIPPLHDALFANAHRLGRQLIELADKGEMIVVESVDDQTVTGYAAGLVQPDRSGFIEFLGVAEAARGRGLGRDLVRGIAERLFEAGADHLALTVRESNAAARSVYRAVGFTELQVMVPYRKGFAVQ